MKKQYTIELHTNDGRRRMIVVKNLRDGEEAFYVGRKIAEALSCEYYMHIEMQDVE